MNRHYISVLVCVSLLINVSLSLAEEINETSKITFKDLGLSSRRVKVPKDEDDRTVRLIVNFPGLEREGELHIFTASMARPLSNIKVYLNDLAIGSSWIEDEITFPLKNMKENNTLMISVRVKGSGKWATVSSDSYIEFRLPEEEIVLPPPSIPPLPPTIELEEVRSDIKEELDALDSSLAFADSLDIDIKDESSKVTDFKKELQTADYEKLMEIEDEIARISYSVQAKIDGAFKGRISSLKINIEGTKNKILESESFLVNIDDASRSIDAAMAYLTKAEKDLDNKEYSNAKKNADNAAILIENAMEKLDAAKREGYQKGRFFVLIQLGAILILLIMILLIRRL